MDVGSRRHSVAIGLSDGQVLEEFEITHRPEGFQEFFSRIEKHQKAQGCGVAVAMEGYKRLCAAARQPGAPAGLSALQHPNYLSLRNIFLPL